MTDAADYDADVLAQEAEVDKLERDLLTLGSLIQHQRQTGQHEPTWVPQLHAR